MSHHLDRAVGSDLSYLCLQRRRQLGEMSLSGFDCTAQPLYPVPSFVARRRQFIADVDEFGDTAQPVPVSIAVGERDSE